MTDQTIVVAGAGQAGAQAAISLRQEGFAGRILLIGEEDAPPYQRPPLSKGFLEGKLKEPDLQLRPAKAYSDQRVELVLGTRIASIDRAARVLSLASGSEVRYDHLVLALGSRSRELQVPGADLNGVHYLRTLVEARALQERLDVVSDVVVIGGGFVGLEFACVARRKGLKVTVVEAAPRALARVLSPEMADSLSLRHRREGVEIRLGRTATRLVGEQGKLSAVQLDDGALVAAQLVVVGIGAVPNVEIARQAGLAVDNGIVVDGFLATQDPAISAIGDCANFPSKFAGHALGGMVRLESVQNAVDQARFVAARLAGKSQAPYDAVPWFWTEQFGAKVQMAGLCAHHDQVVLRGDRSGDGWSALCFRGGVFLGAESLNKAHEHMTVRRLLGAAIPLTPQQAADGSLDLKTLVTA